MKKILLHEITPEELADMIAEKVAEKLSGSSELLSRDETCEFLNIKPTTLWEWTNKGKIQAYGIGGKRYYKKSELMDSVKKLKK